MEEQIIDLGWNTDYVFSEKTGKGSGGHTVVDLGCSALESGIQQGARKEY